jgi:hypothetical protein
MSAISRKSRLVIGISDNYLQKVGKDLAGIILGRCQFSITIKSEVPRVTGPEIFMPANIISAAHDAKEAKHNQ